MSDHTTDDEYRVNLEMNGSLAQLTSGLSEWEQSSISVFMAMSPYPKGGDSTVFCLARLRFSWLLTQSQKLTTRGHSFRENTTGSDCHVTTVGRLSVTVVPNGIPRNRRLRSM
jgi:hypothetical protein